MSGDPELPQPAFPDLDSMLSRKFGKEIANYFAGSPLNRVSFLRGDSKFLSAAVRHPSTSFILCKDLAPLAKDPSSLYFSDYQEVQSLIGDEPFQPEEDKLKNFNSKNSIPQLVFLGLNEEQKNGFEWNIYAGCPYFALDVTPEQRGLAPLVAEAAKKLVESKEKEGLTFMGGRSHMSLPAGQAAMYGQGRALLDWNSRNPFCAGCGQRTLSINAGYKRACPPTDLGHESLAPGGTEPFRREDCKTRHGVSNLSFPRTDPTVIMAVLSSDGARVLLGRQKRWPPCWYSTLAGFVEPAESIEEAVRREVWEESGITLGRVIIHSTQPWPFPANLMIGAIAQAVPGGEEVQLKHDPELEDARWVPLDELREALKNGTSRLDEGPGKEWREGQLRLPPKTAIAHVLMDALVNGGFMSGVTKI